jgi:enamine deaminase RidA (YjgF/YER057c/UK114 family)
LYDGVLRFEAHYIVGALYARIVLIKPIVSHLQNAYLPYAELQQQSAEWWEQVLGVVCFGDPLPLAHGVVLSVALPPLLSSGAVCEVWQSAAPVTSGRVRDIQYRCNDEFLFGVITLDETDFLGNDVGSALQLAAADAYQQVGMLLDQLHFPHVLRFWNYMSDINAHSHGLERYRQFNVGRQVGLLAQGRAVTGGLPAACALGTPAGALSIAFMAGRVAPIAIENPRQLNACAYPPVYGPRSPTFSRAALLPWSDGACLFISGTASIVGHESLHVENVVAQTKEALKNIAAVLDSANRQLGCGEFDLRDLHYTVYVKHVADLNKVKAVLDTVAGTGIQAIYLQADVCRQELLVEIEAAQVVSSAESR